MRQKAINLDQNKVRSLFPLLAGSANTDRFVVKVQVFISEMPTISAVQSITLSQKNWRLNGLLRGDLPVSPGDVLLCQLLGDDATTEARIPSGVVLALVHPGEQGFDWLRARCPAHGFGDLDDYALLGAESWSPDGAVWRMIENLTRGLGEIVEDVITPEERGGVRAAGLRSIDRSGSTREAVEQVSRMRAAVGLGGEVLADDILRRRLSSGLIESYDWIAASDARAPVDFRFVTSGTTVNVEVKTTKGPHETPFFISFAELRQAATGVAYEVWRVSGLSRSNELLAGDVRRTNPSGLARQAVDWAMTAPGGVRIPTFEFRPEAFSWSEPETAQCPVSRIPKSETWLSDFQLPIP